MAARTTAMMVAAVPRLSSPALRALPRGALVQKKPAAQVRAIPFRAPV